MVIQIRRTCAGMYQRTFIHVLVLLCREKYRNWKCCNFPQTTDVLLYSDKMYLRWHHRWWRPDACRATTRFLWLQQQKQVHLMRFSVSVKLCISSSTNCNPKAFLCLNLTRQQCCQDTKKENGNWKRDESLNLPPTFILLIRFYARALHSFQSAPCSKVSGSRQQ